MNHVMLPGHTGSVVDSQRSKEEGLDPLRTNRRGRKRLAAPLSEGAAGRVKRRGAGDLIK